MLVKFKTETSIKSFKGFIKKESKVYRQSQKAKEIVRKEFKYELS